MEHLVPRNGAEVLRQSELGIDLAPGYEGTLVVNGVEMPTAQLRLVPEQNQVFFTPGEGKVIDELPGRPDVRGRRSCGAPPPGAAAPRRPLPLVLRRDLS